MDVFRLATIGLDTSHVVEFARAIQGADNPAKRLGGIRVVTYCRFPSVFQSEENQDIRAAQLREWGISAAASPEDAASGADGFLVTMNNPVEHLPMMERLIPLGKPVFLDKPVADSPRNARAIASAARDGGIRWWSASAAPMLDAVARTRRLMPAPRYVHAYGPLGKAAAGSDVVWYGCHCFEMLVSLLGTGAKGVRAFSDDGGVVARIDYEDGRRGMVELIPDVWRYGGRADDGKTVLPFQHDPAGDAPMYANMARALRDFFLFGETAVAPENAVEALELAAATDESLANHGQRAFILKSPQ